MCFFAGLPGCSNELFRKNITKTIIYEVGIGLALFLAANGFYASRPMEFLDGYLRRSSDGGFGSPGSVACDGEHLG
jgi:hypothetical protein